MSVSIELIEVFCRTCRGIWFAEKSSFLVSGQQNDEGNVTINIEMEVC